MNYFAKEESLKFTDPMKVYLEEKVQKLSKYVKNLDGKVTLKREGKLKKLEITLPGGIRSSASHDDYYELVLIVIDQIERQLDKYKSLKMHNRNQKVVENLVDFDQTQAEIKPYIIREKVVPAETMSNEDAIEKMELLGHTFFVFIDKYTGRTHVAYKRLDGGYGVLIVMHDYY